MFATVHLRTPYESTQKLSLCFYEEVVFGTAVAKHGPTTGCYGPSDPAKQGNGIIVLSKPLVSPND